MNAINQISTIRYFHDLEQGSEEWLAARCGLLTASEMKLIITPKLAAASNEKERIHLWELAAQRINQYVEPTYIGDDMLRGHEDEIEARILYEQHYAKVDEVGFVTNSRWGFTLGCSPDGLVGDDGVIECKSRRQKYQVETIVDHAPFDTIPPDYVIQVQTILLVTERNWCDFISYCGGLPMVTIRAYPDPKIQDAIINAAGEFEQRIAARLEMFRTAAAENGRHRMIPTERKIVQEMFLS